MRSLLYFALPIALFLSAILGAAEVPNPGAVAINPPSSPNPAVYHVAGRLFTDPFSGDLSPWKIELEQGGSVVSHEGTLSIDVPRGATVWFAHELTGPVLIQYEARLIHTEPPAQPGPNDRVSDLNAFWMANDTRNDKNFFNVPERNGKFATYNQLKTYYVGQGGNGNKTTRFRRYIGDAVDRPLLPEHNLTAKEFLLTPNVWQTIQLVAYGSLIEYYRDGKRIFTFSDTAPYTHGYFGFRTTFSHVELKNFRIFHLSPTVATTKPSQ